MKAIRIEIWLTDEEVDAAERLNARSNANRSAWLQMSLRERLHAIAAVSIHRALREFDPTLPNCYGPPAPATSAAQASLTPDP
ncbi:MAG TPA: hypothetical protein VJ783_25785 [Pirellulales bacterium]|nr:hypothetical protein [Pirellulales bacterium]